MSKASVAPSGRRRWSYVRADRTGFERHRPCVGCGDLVRQGQCDSDDTSTISLIELSRTVWDGYRRQLPIKIYVVQTITEVIERCILMTTDPGDLVLDPTCGSGTTAYVAEQWGRRWITIDTCRVAVALARSRLMGARYPYYLLADSPEGQRKEAEVTRSTPKIDADPRRHPPRLRLSSACRTSR